MDSVKSIITALHVFFETAFSYLTMLSNISKKKKKLLLIAVVSFGSLSHFCRKVTET